MTEEQLHQQLGQAAALMLRCDDYCHYPIACLGVWIRPAVLLNQIHFFTDTAGHVVGYMTWARLAEDSEHRLLHDPHFLLHAVEWNEGDRLWILDFVLTTGRLRRSLHEAALLFPKDRTARSARRREDGSIRRLRTWHRARLVCATSE
jgi:cytolysin-activating lysine-acyltransferase